MKRLGFLLLAGALFTWNASAQTGASAQTNASAKTNTSANASKSGAQASAGGSASSSSSASAQAGQNSASLDSGTTLEAALANSLDAHKNKVGDQVVAKTTHDVKSGGQVVIPKGSKLIGHVSQAQARGEGQAQSALGVVFDHAVLKNGRQMPLHVVVQALAAAETATSASAEGMEPMAPVMAGGSGGAMGSGRPSGGGLLSGAGSAVNSTVGAASSATGSVADAASRPVGATASSATNAAGSATAGHGGLNAAGMLTSTTSGVFGLKGLSLNSEASNATQGSLIVSSTRNVHLDSGTRMLLRAEGSTQDSSAKQASHPQPQAQPAPQKPPKEGGQQKP